MTTEQSALGRIEAFEDFIGTEFPVEVATHYKNIGAFQMTGLNIHQTTAGAVQQASGGLNGVVRFTTYTTDSDSVFLRTAECLDVAKMAPLVMECRIKSETITLQENFFGLCNISDPDDNIEDHIIDTSAGTTTITDFTATHCCGFLRSSELTAVAEWHAIWKGGTTSALTTTAAGELGVNMVAGDWQILRIEVDPNGTARWYIDGVLLKTLAGAVSTTEDLACILGVTDLATTTVTAEMDADYMLVRANRDWTV